MKQSTFRELLDYAAKLNDDGVISINDPATPAYLIGSILISWMALESFVNNMMEDFAALPPGKFTVHERGFIEEKQVYFETSGAKAGTFTISNQTEFRRLEDKIMFLIVKCGGGTLCKGDPLWQRFDATKKKRNALSHYRQNSEINVTSHDSTEAINVTKELINLLSKNVWKKPVKW